MKKSIKWILTGATLLAGVVCLFMTAYAVYRTANLSLLQQTTPEAQKSVYGTQMVALIFLPAALLLPAIASRKLPPLAGAWLALVLGMVQGFFFWFVVIGDLLDIIALMMGVPVVGFVCAFMLSLIQRSEQRVQADQIKVGARRRAA